MTTTSGDVVGKVNQLIEMQDESGNNTEKLSRRMSSIFGNMDRMEQSMIVIRKQVNKDIRARERYFSEESKICLLYTSPSPRDRQKSRMPSSA